MEESEGFIPCNICELEKEYHDDIFQTYEIAICDDCNIPEIFNDTCYGCDKIFPDEEIDFLVFAFKKVIKCVQCLAQTNDIELEKTFLNYRYNIIEIHMIENLYINKYIDELKIKSEKDNNIFYSDCNKPNINSENITFEDKSSIKNKNFNNVNRNDCLDCGFFKSICICEKFNVNNYMFNKYDDSPRINKLHENIRNISENKINNLNIPQKEKDDDNFLNLEKEIIQTDIKLPKTYSTEISSSTNKNNTNIAYDNIDEKSDYGINDILENEKDNKIKENFNKFMLGIKKRIIIKRIKKFINKRRKKSTSYINQHVVNKLIKNIDKYMKISIFDDTYKNNRNTIDLFSIYYEKFIINKKDNDIKFIRQLHDKNHGRFLRIIELYYLIKKDNILYNSKIIFNYYTLEKIHKKNDNFDVFLNLLKNNLGVKK